ncbi:hypothetical protein Vretimale_11285, partial [Volvox reticuliferus]
MDALRQQSGLVNQQKLEFEHNGSEEPDEFPSLLLDRHQQACCNTKSSLTAVYEVTTPTTRNPPSSAATMSARSAWLLSRVTSSPNLHPPGPEPGSSSETRFPRPVGGSRGELNNPSSAHRKQRLLSAHLPDDPSIATPMSCAAASVPPVLILPVAASRNSSPVTAAAAAESAIPMRRYPIGSGGGTAKAHLHSRQVPSATASAAANLPYGDGGSGSAGGGTSTNPRSRAYAAFLSMRRRTVVLINLVSVMERMDEQIVPALSRPLGCAFRAGPHQLGLITFARALVQAVASPLGGLAGHYFDRVTVLFLGCAIWGFFCTAFAFATTVNQGIAAWAFNGVGLSLIIPNSQSLVADYYMATQRGEAFGTLMLTGAVGGMLGAMFATNVGGMAPLGVAGWRVAFVAVGAVSLVIGALTLLLAVDPTRHHRNAASRHVNRRNHHLKERFMKAAVTNNSASGFAATDVWEAATPQQRQQHRRSPAADQVGDVAGIAVAPRHISGGGADDHEAEVGELPYLRSCEMDPERDSEHLYNDSDLSERMEVEPLLLRRKAVPGSGGDGNTAAAPSPSVSSPSSLTTDIPSGDHPSPQRPLLCRYKPAAAAAAAAGARSTYGHSHRKRRPGRSSYKHSTEAESMTMAMESSSAPTNRGKGRGSGDEGLVVAACTVEGGGYDSAAMTAAAVLGSNREGRPVLTWHRLWAMITTPTFLIIILQGIVGSTPWNALVFLTLYLQLIGFSDATASSLMAL